MSRWALLLFLAVWKRGILADDPVVSDEAKLETRIFQDYDSERRPVKDHTQAVNVGVAMNLKYFTVDDVSDTITVHCWMLMIWNDQFLTWDPEEYSGIQRLQVDSLKLWQPQLFLYNADITSQGSDGRFETSCLLLYTGSLICVPHVSHTALCAPDPRRWPYDVQNCTLRFGAWMHSGEQINFTFGPTPVILGDYQSNREWELKSYSTSKNPGVYKMSNETYPSLRFSFILKRRSATHAAIVIIPAISLALLTTSCGLVPPGALRLGVAMTSLMIQVVYLMDISWYVPSHGDYPAYIIMFFRDSVLITTIVILTSIVTMAITKFTRPPPRLVAVFVNIAKNGAAKFVSFGEFDPNTSPIVAEEGENNIQLERERTANMEWQKFASVFNNIFFITIAFTYMLLIFIYVLS